MHDTNYTDFNQFYTYMYYSVISDKWRINQHESVHVCEHFSTVFLVLLSMTYCRNT